MSLHRRDFIRLATAAAAVSGAPRSFAQILPPATASAKLNFGRKPVALMPTDFTGLSYESPQLLNPQFFAPTNIGLVTLFRNLSPSGVLRTGGNLSAFTAWRDDPSIPLTPAEQSSVNRGKKYWEWDLCDPTVAKGNREAVFTPESIESLAAFLQATGWKLIYGLNFGTGTPQQAAAEAASVQKLVGKNLIAFQLGNELDFWTGGMRPKDWSFENYYKQWKEWTAIIRASVPNAPFGGPDVAIRLDWMEKLAEHEGNNIAILSKHHYAMGPAGDPRMNAEHLLGPDPEVANEIASAQRAKAFAGVGFRTTECGSCFHGGQPGVSDAFASALWCADYMLTLAQGGHAGVNLHGGGDGFYSPIVGDPTRGITARPSYFGMQFAQSFAGSALLPPSFDCGSANASAFVGIRKGETLVAVVNKGPVNLRVDLDRKHFTAATLLSALRLSAPALDSHTGVSFAQLADPATVFKASQASATFEAPAYTGTLLRFRTT